MPIKKKVKLNKRQLLWAIYKKLPNRDPAIKFLGSTIKSLTIAIDLAKNPPKKRKPRTILSEKDSLWNKLLKASDDKPGIKKDKSSINDIKNRLRLLDVFVPTKSPAIPIASKKELINVRETLGIKTIKKQLKIKLKIRKKPNLRLAIWEELNILTNNNPGIKLRGTKTEDIENLVNVIRKKTAPLSAAEIKKLDTRRENEFKKIKSKIKNKEKLLDRVNDFKQYRIETNANTITGLYASIKKLRDKHGSLPYISLILQDVQDPTRAPRYTTINTDFTDSLKDFTDRLKDIAAGDVEGSSPIFNEQYQLVINRYDANFIDPLAAEGGSNEEFLALVEEIKSTGKTNCVYDSMNHLGYNIPKKIKSLKDLYKFIKKKNINIEIVENKICLKKDTKFTEIWEYGEPKFYNVKVGKRKKKMKLSKLDIKYYDFYHAKFPELEKDDESNSGNYVENPKPIQYILYSRNNKHVAPLKIKDGFYIKRDDLYISSKQEIYIIVNDQPKLILSKKNIIEYMRRGTVSQPAKKKSNCQHRFLVIDYEAITDWNLKQIMVPYSLSVLDLSDKEMVKLREYEVCYSDFIKKGWIDADDQYWYKKDLDYSRFSEKEQKDCIPISVNMIKTSIKKMREKAKTYIGWDCTYKLIDYIRSQCQFSPDPKDPDPMVPRYTIMTYNGSNFDNCLMLTDILAHEDYADSVSDIFFTNMMLRNFKINKRHEMFDLNRHISGSLKYNCKAYKINLFPKKEIDFRKIQSLYDRGLLDGMMDIYNKKTKITDYDEDTQKAMDLDYLDKLAEYNDYDVLSLATLYSKYSSEMCTLVQKALEPTYKQIAADVESGLLKETIKYNSCIYASKTIGSLIYGMLKFYWKYELKVKMPKFIIPKKPFVNIPEELKKWINIYGGFKDDIPKETEKQINIIREINKGIAETNKPIHEKNKKLYQFYKDIQKYKTAGRVELFNGRQKVIGRTRSMDVTSSYPYEMCVDKVYFPTDDLVELSNYNPNISIGDKNFKLKDKISFWYVDLDQSVLRNKGLPNLVAEKTGVENVWRTKRVLINYLISSVMIDEMVSYGMVIGKDILIHNGFYFTDRVKSWKLFKPLLTFMIAKNEQDKWKEAGDERYNHARRATTKLALNVPSGKIIEKIHVDKITEIKNAKHFYEMKCSDSIYKMNTINIMGNRIFCSYSKKEEDMMNNHRPIYWGALVYVYAQLNLYNNTLAAGYNFNPSESEEKRVERQIEYRKHLLLCDTDASKMDNYAAKICLERMSKLNVRHWEEVEKWDDRYKDHKMYDPNSKVFGGFEDEFPAYNNVSFWLAKKHYAPFFNPSMKHEKPTKKHEIEEYEKLIKNNETTCLEFRWKGINPNSLVIDEHLVHIDKNHAIKVTEKGKINISANSKVFTSKHFRNINRYEIKSEQRAYHYYNCDRIKENTCVSGKRSFEYFNRLSRGEELNILCQSFRKQMSNLKRNTEISDTGRMNNQFNTVSLAFVIKKISCPNKPVGEDEHFVKGVDIPFDAYMHQSNSDISDNDEESDNIEEK